MFSFRWDVSGRLRDSYGGGRPGLPYGVCSAGLLERRHGAPYTVRLFHPWLATSVRHHRLDLPSHWLYVVVSIIISLCHFSALRYSFNKHPIARFLLCQRSLKSMRNWIIWIHKNWWYSNSKTTENWRQSWCQLYCNLWLRGLPWFQPQAHHWW